MFGPRLPTRADGFGTRTMGGLHQAGSSSCLQVVVTQQPKWSSQRTVLRYGRPPASTSTARDHPQADGRSRRRCPPQQPQPEADWHGTPAVEHVRVGGSGCQGDSGGDMRRMQLSLRAEVQREFSQSHVCSALSLIDLLRLALASDDAALGSAAASVNSRRLAELLRSTCHDELVRAALGRVQSTLCRMQMLKYRRLSCDCVTRSRSPMCLRRTAWSKVAHGS